MNLNKFLYTASESRCAMSRTQIIMPILFINSITPALHHVHFGTARSPQLNYAKWQKTDASKTALVSHSSTRKKSLPSASSHVEYSLHDSDLFLWGVLKAKVYDVTFKHWRSWKHQLRNTFTKFHRLPCGTCWEIRNGVCNRVCKKMEPNSNIFCRIKDSITTKNLLTDTL